MCNTLQLDIKASYDGKTVCLQTECTGLFISPSGISELDCATTKTDTAVRSISIGPGRTYE